MTVLTRENITQQLGPANASATAQRTGSGLGIQSIRRGVARAQIGPDASDFTVAATSFAAITPTLGLTVTLSGRPIRVVLSATVSAGSGGNVALDVLMRGVSIADADDGLMLTESEAVTTLTAEELVMAPQPGAASFQVVARRDTADGTVHVVNSRALLTVVEL